MSPSTFASLRYPPVSQAYYQHKRNQGKHHNQAVLALAHRRIPTLHATIHEGHPLQPTTRHETTRNQLTHHIGAPPQTGGFHQPGDPITVGIDERDHLVVGQPSPTAKKPRLCTETRSRNATQESLCAVC